MAIISIIIFIYLVAGVFPRGRRGKYTGRRRKCAYGNPRASRQPRARGALYQTSRWH